MSMNDKIRMMVLMPHVECLLRQETIAGNTEYALKRKAYEMFRFTGDNYKFTEAASIPATAHDPIRRQALISNMGELLKEAAKNVLEAAGLAPEAAGQVKAPSPGLRQLAAE